MKPQRRRPEPKETRHPRQVLAGNAVRPADDPWAVSSGKLPLTTLQRNFLVIALVLLIIGGMLAFFGQLMLATIPFFLLALMLIAGRFVF